MSTAPAALDGFVRAVTRQIDPPDDVLDALGDDGVAWIHEGAAFVTSGVVARFGVSNGDWRVLCHSYVRLVA